LDLAEHLTLDGLLPFRQAHALVGALVYEMVNRSIKPNSLTPKIVETLAKKVLGRQIKIPSSVIEDVTDPRRCLANRSSLGSPNPKHVEQLFQESRNIISNAEEVLKTRLERLETSRVELSKLVNQYTEFTE
jgi:argininosuccinate lyase